MENKKFEVKVYYLDFVFTALKHKMKQEQS